MPELDRDSDGSRPFTLWALSDAHVGTDLQHGRESLADALRQSESPNGFEWDIAVNLGDHSGSHGSPDDEEGREVVKQYGALRSHRREDVYDLGGNHDRSDIGEQEGQWVDRWLDPTGSHAELSGVHADRRKYPVKGNWERYSFEVGNILFLMMSDRNEDSHRLSREEGGGNPSGVVTRETFDWWRNEVESHPHHIIVTAHHYVLKDTTVGSGDWEGCWRDEDGNIQHRFHVYRENGTPRGASYLYWVDGQQDSGTFENYLSSNNAATSVWMGGHTHTRPDDTTGDKTHIETRWGTHFLNVSALTRHHAGSVPMSRVLTFTPGSTELRIRCYLHTDDFATQGFCDQYENVVELARPFIRD